MLIIEYAHLPKSFHDGYIISIEGKYQMVIIEESLSDNDKSIIANKIIEKFHYLNSQR